MSIKKTLHYGTRKGWTARVEYITSYVQANTQKSKRNELMRGYNTVSSSWGLARNRTHVARHFVTRGEKGGSDVTPYPDEAAWKIIDLGALYTHNISIAAREGFSSIKDHRWNISPLGYRDSLFSRRIIPVIRVKRGNSE